MKNFEKELFYSGEQIRVIREEAGLSQEELADSLAISTRTLSRYENGLRAAPLDFLFQFSDLMNIPISKIIPPSFEKDILLSSISQQYNKLDPLKQKLICDAVTAMVAGLLLNT